jgi:hypothetical protein
MLKEHIAKVEGGISWRQNASGNLVEQGWNW